MKSDLLNLVAGCIIGLLAVILSYVMTALAGSTLTIKFVFLLFVIVSLLFAEILDLVDHFKNK